MLKVLILAVIMLSIAMVFMAINILFRKKGKFPEYRVGHNRNMKKIGLSCVKHEELKCHRELKKEGCSSCGIIEGV